MTPAERKGLAESLMANPLYDEIMSGIEASAIERMIYAVDDKTRLEAALAVKASRSFRQDCEAALHSDQPRKGAPA